MSAGLSPEASFVPGSYRDRSARVFVAGDQVLRGLTAEAAEVWQRLQPSTFWRQITAAGQVVPTQESADSQGWASARGYPLVLRHERVPELSWPWEWSFSMLRDAALLQLSLLQQALPAGFDMADATPFNFQFRGANPQLIDVGSLRLRHEQGIWEGYRQFCEQFLAPLLLQSWKQVDFQPWLRGRMSGIPLRQLSGLLSWRDLLFRRGAFTHIWLHSRMAAAMRHRGGGEGTAALSTQMVLNNLQGLSTLLQSLKWTAVDSEWRDYYETAEHASAHEAEKSRFVRAACDRVQPQLTWDLGCNQGRFSRIAAEWGRVLALDADHAVIERLYCSLTGEASDSLSRQRITPLVCNLADPSPAQGWRLSERGSLESRSRPQLVLCLALIHHLVMGSGLLLEDVISWLASLQAPVVLEWVERTDPIIRNMLQQRRDVFADYCDERLQAAVGRHFRTVTEQRLSGGSRTLLLLLPLSAVTGGEA